MKRKPEPELMLGEAQAKAYAEADFEEPHNLFVRLFARAFPGNHSGKTALDLGCGAGDITVRMAARFPSLNFHGLDGSRAMLEQARLRRTHQPAGIRRRIRYFMARIPECRLPRSRYDIIVSNSLLHHLPDPAILWETINKWSRPGTKVFVMDLLRPESETCARRIAKKYSRDEPEILRRDFYNSLRAAYTPGELSEQLRRFGLSDLAVTVVSDRHWTASGIYRSSNDPGKRLL